LNTVIIRYLPFWLLPVLGVVLYLNTLPNEFLAWDDTRYVIENPHIQAINISSVKWMFSAFYFANWHPLTWLSYALDYALWGSQPWGYHLTNVLLFALNTWLFTLLTWYLLSDLAKRKYYLPKTVTPALWFSGLLFACHPLHVEVVAWISQRKELLAFTFTLLTLLAYWRFTRHSRIWSREYLLTLLALSAALMSKPIAVILPLILLIMDFFPLQRLGWTWLSVMYLLREKIPFFLLSLATAIATLLAQAGAGAVSDTSILPMDTRLLNAIHSTLFYLSKWLLPLDLSPFYPYPLHNQMWHWPTLVAAIALGLAIVLALTAWQYQRPWWLAALMFYLLTLLPVIGIIQVGTQAAADRYTYLSTLPFFWLAGVGFGHWWNKARSWVLIVAILWLGGLTWQTQNMIAVWKNDITLWSRVIDYAPYSHLAHSNIAGAYLRTGDAEQAIVHYRAAMETSVKVGDYYFLAIAYLNRGQYAKARQVYERMLAMKLNAGAQQATVYANLATLYAQANELEQAQLMLQQALTLAPRHPTALALQQRLHPQ